MTSNGVYFQGLEIVNPQAAEKRVQEANAKYFSSTASFVKVEKQLWHK
jgi:U4/U6 small nuclear ribonucleoprotein PRP31